MTDVDVLPSSTDLHADSAAPAQATATATAPTTQMATPPLEDRERDPRPARSRSRSPAPERERFRGAPPRGGYRDGPRRPTAPEASKVLGVFALSIRTRERDLEEEFGRFGTVEKATIVYDQRSDRSRGFGFVTMSTVEEATKCIENLNGVMLNDRNIRVDYSLTERPHQSTPGEYMGYRRDRERRGGDFGGGGGGGGGRGRYERDRDHRDRDSSRRDDRRDPYGRDDRDRDRNWRDDRDRSDRRSSRRSPEYSSGARRYSRSPSPRRSSRRSPSPRPSRDAAASDKW